MGCRLEESRPTSFREDVRSLLLRLLLSVVSEREPDIAKVLKEFSTNAASTFVAK